MKTLAKQLMMSRKPVKLTSPLKLKLSPTNLEKHPLKKSSSSRLVSSMERCPKPKMLGLSDPKPDLTYGIIMGTPEMYQYANTTRFEIPRGRKSIDGMPQKPSDVLHTNYNLNFTTSTCRSQLSLLCED